MFRGKLTLVDLLGLSQILTYRHKHALNHKNLLRLTRWPYPLSLTALNPRSCTPDFITRTCGGGGDTTPHAFRN